MYKLENFIFSHFEKIVLMLFVLILFVGYNGIISDYSEGSRVGVITKLSHKGLLFKSWEGSINQGGTKLEPDSEGNNHVVLNATDFSVVDVKVVDKLQTAYKTGKRVEIVYKQWFLAPLTQNTQYTITDIVFLDN